MWVWCTLWEDGRFIYQSVMGRERIPIPSKLVCYTPLKNDDWGVMVGAHPCLEELIARDMLQLGLSQKENYPRRSSVSSTTVIQRRIVQTQRNHDHGQNKRGTVILNFCHKYFYRLSQVHDVLTIVGKSTYDKSVEWRFESPYLATPSPRGL
jgi:hypothetical protein